MGRLSSARHHASRHGADKGADGSGRQFLTFRLGGESYALDILNVKEIIDYGRLTELPMMPTSIRGVINLRGAVVPVVDLAAHFSGQSSEVRQRTCIVIAEVERDHHKLDVGLMVDAVSEVIEIPADDIEQPPEFVGNIHAEYIDGMAKINNEFIVILDILNCLSTEDLESLARVRKVAAAQAGGQASNHNSDNA
jgi:purine-binding chemotaxis protein CheW